MRIARRAPYFGANARKERTIFNEGDSIFLSWGIERWPPTSRMKLCFGAEELAITDFADIYANSLGIGVLANKGALGCALSKNGITQRI